MTTKMNLSELKSLFTATKSAGYSRISKHNASKKGFAHKHNLSKGQKNSADHKSANIYMANRRLSELALL